GDGLRRAPSDRAGGLLRTGRRAKHGTARPCRGGPARCSPLRRVRDGGRAAMTIAIPASERRRPHGGTLSIGRGWPGAHSIEEYVDRRADDPADFVSGWRRAEPQCHAQVKVAADHADKMVRRLGAVADLDIAAVLGRFETFGELRAREAGALLVEFQDEIREAR